MAAKVNQRHFQSFFRSKKVDITETSLEAFVAVTQPNSLGCLVEDLALVGIVNNPKMLETMLLGKTGTVPEHLAGLVSATERWYSPEELGNAELDLEKLRSRRVVHEKLRQSGRDVTLLAKAFSNIAAYGKICRLRSLSLKVAVHSEDAINRRSPGRGYGWEYTWQITADTYQTLMSALAASELEIESLQIFSDPRMRCCSIARDKVTAVDFADPGLATSLATVRSLSISISDRMIEPRKRDSGMTGKTREAIHWFVSQKEKDIETMSVEAADDSNFIGLAKLIDLCRNIRELDLHYYKLRFEQLRNPDLHVDRVLRQIIETASDSLAKVQKCRLRGLKVREEDLLALVEQPSIKELALENTHMIGGGKFAPIFDYCTSATAGMQRLFFDDLFEHKMLHFEGPGEAKFPSMGGSAGPNTLTREGADVQRKINYTFAHGRSMGSGQTHTWHRQRVAEYGPP